ncbi:porin family protein [Chitinophagaceae bacterium 26-R-25]|nr:porin family protein [Chitinophagaceae bacterium 26-R-25]
MKKTLLFVLFIAAKQCIFAQKVDLGFKIHPLVGWFNGTEGIATAGGPRIGYSYGVMGDFYISDNYAFATELAITNICGKLDYLGSKENQLKMRLSYVDLPISLKLKTNKSSSNPFRYYGQFGFMPSFKIGGKIKNDAGDQTSISSDLQPVKASLLIGGGTEYTLQDNTRLLLGITYNSGLSNVFKKSEDFSSKISYIALNVGIFF